MIPVWLLVYWLPGKFCIQPFGFSGKISLFTQHPIHMQCSELTLWPHPYLPHLSVCFLKFRLWKVLVSSHSYHNCHTFVMLSLMSPSEFFTWWWFFFIVTINQVNMPNASSKGHKINLYWSWISCNKVRGLVTFSLLQIIIKLQHLLWIHSTDFPSLSFL